MSRNDLGAASGIAGHRATCDLSGEGEVVHPGDAEHGVVDAVAFEAAAAEDLPGLHAGEVVLDTGSDLFVGPVVGSRELAISELDRVGARPRAGGMTMSFATESAVSCGTFQTLPRMPTSPDSEHQPVTNNSITAPATAPSP